MNVANLRRAVADRPCCAAAPELEFLEDIKNEFAILFKLNHSFSRSVIRDLVGVLHFSHEILIIVAINAVERLLGMIWTLAPDAYEDDLLTPAARAEGLGLRGTCKSVYLSG